MESALLLCVHACNYRNEENGTNLILDHSKFSCFGLSYAAEREFCTVLLKASISPWLWRWYGDPKICLTFILIKYTSKILLTDSLPLSDWRISGYPCIKTCAIAILTVITFVILIRIAQVCFEKWST